MVNNIIKKKMLISGNWYESADKKSIPIENPSLRNSIIAEVPRANSEDVNIAVESAFNSFKSWKRLPARNRGDKLIEIASYLEGKVEEIAKIISSETGNAISTQSRNEVKSSIDVFRYFGGLANELKGESSSINDSFMVFTKREPYGVVGGIIPWNHPVLLASVKIAPAILAGNTIVLKPAEDSPLGVLELAAACKKILPAGVVNIITGFGEECGNALVKHPLISKIGFTGSTEVGKNIMQCAANRIAPISLELGGKSPQIVYPDADTEETVKGVISAARFSRQGQSCSAGERLYIHSSIVDSFSDKLVNKISKLKIGDPLDEKSYMGAINNKKQFNKVKSFIKEGLNDEKMELLYGGLPPTTGELSQGYYIEPTLFKYKGNNDNRIVKEEVFGPILVIIPWDTEEEVLNMANESKYGLSAFVWTQNINKALKASDKLDCGWVQINSGKGPEPGISFGGFKQSGIGRDFSLEGMLDSYTQVKSVSIDYQE